MLALSLSPLLVFEVRNDPTPKDEEQKDKEQKGTYNTKITETSFFIAYSQAIYSQLLVHMALPGRSRTRYRWRL